MHTMEKKTVKLGIVGLFRGRNVVARTMNNRNFELRAICDKNPERLETARKLFEEEHKVENLLCFESFEELLKSDVDAVYIATDAPLHTPQVIQALEAGDLYGVAKRLYNVFEDALEGTQKAEVDSIKATLLRCGALGAAMSGSGPTAFGLFDDEEKAKQAYETLSGQYRETYLTQSV